MQERSDNNSFFLADSQHFPISNDNSLIIHDTTRLFPRSGSQERVYECDNNSDPFFDVADERFGKVTMFAEDFKSVDVIDPELRHVTYYHLPRLESSQNRRIRTVT